MALQSENNDNMLQENWVRANVKNLHWKRQSKLLWVYMYNNFNLWTMFNIKNVFKVFQ